MLTWLPLAGGRKGIGPQKRCSLQPEDLCGVAFTTRQEKFPLTLTFQLVQTHIVLR
jgi:hypothetical protein